MHLFLCQHHTVLITVALQYSLKSGSMIPPALFFCLKTVLALWDLLCFQTSFKIICSSSVENATGILIGIAMNLEIVLGSIVILTTLILPIHEVGISFHLFVSSLISFFFFFLRFLY